MSGPITSRFTRAATADEVLAGHDLSGKTIVVTGGASGLGYETARALAKVGARVLIAVRDLAAGETAAAAIRAETPNARVEVGQLDLADLTSVGACAGWLQAEAPVIDVFIANAGISNTPQSHGPNGWELRFATNHVGHAVLITAVLPQLRRAGPARVVMVASAAHKGSAVEFDDIHFRHRPWDPFKAYGQSKSANVLYAVGFTRRFARQGLTANALQPGSIITRLQRHNTRERMILNGLLDETGQPVADTRTPEQGAATSVWAAVAPELDGVGGLYLENCAESLPVGPDTHKWEGWAPHARDPEAAERLWAVTEAMVGPIS